MIENINLLVSDKKIKDEELKIMLQKHGCYYLLHQMDEQDGLVSKKLLVNKRIISTRYRFCANLFSEISNIPYAVVKGAVLSKKIYGDVAFRFSRDIDLLVAEKNLDKIEEILNCQGFVQGRVKSNKILLYTRAECVYYKTYSHQLAPFIKETGETLCPFVVVDVNYDIFWGEKEKRTDIDAFLQNLENCTIEGVKVRELAPEEEFIALCLHHYKDMNSVYLLSQGSLKLSLLCDIYFYMVKAKLNMELLLKKSQFYGVSEYVYYCIYATSIIFGKTNLHKQLTLLYSNKAEELLDKFGLTETERRTWKEPFEERLFSDNFYELFSEYLTSSDYRKIEINKQYM